MLFKDMVTVVEFESCHACMYCDAMPKNVEYSTISWDFDVTVYILFHV